MLQKVQGCYENHYLFKEGRNFVSMQINERSYSLGDIVEIAGDCRGYLGPGLTSSKEPQYARIVRFTNKDADYYFVVETEGGEKGSIKEARINKVIPIQHEDEIRCLFPLLYYGI